MCKRWIRSPFKPAWTYLFTQEECEYNCVGAAWKYTWAHIRVRIGTCASHAHTQACMPGYLSMMVEIINERHLQLREQVLHKYAYFYFVLYNWRHWDSEKMVKVIWIQIIDEIMMWVTANLVISWCTFSNIIPLKRKCG